MINRTGTAYIDLPENMHERRSKIVKMQLSITINCPPSLEKKYKKFIEEMEASNAKEFSKFTKKLIKKADEKNGE